MKKCQDCGGEARVMLSTRGYLATCTECPTSTLSFETAAEAELQWDADSTQEKKVRRAALAWLEENEPSWHLKASIDRRKYLSEVMKRAR